MKQEFEVPEIEGYEYTGEYRQPTTGEFFLVGSMISRAYDYISCDYPILRPRWVAPRWLPDGVWVYEFEENHWYACRLEPGPFDDYFNAQGDDDSDVFLDMLAALNGEEFVPPTGTRKVQVKR